MSAPSPRAYQHYMLKYESVPPSSIKEGIQSKGAHAPLLRRHEKISEAQAQRREWTASKGIEDIQSMGEYTVGKGIDDIPLLKASVYYLQGP